MDRYRKEFNYKDIKDVEKILNKQRKDKEIDKTLHTLMEDKELSAMATWFESSKYGFKLEGLKYSTESDFKKTKEYKEAFKLLSKDSIDNNKFISSFWEEEGTQLDKLIKTIKKFSIKNNVKGF
jgi:hypothetical protein